MFLKKNRKKGKREEREGKEPWRWIIEEIKNQLAPIAVNKNAERYRNGVMRKRGRRVEREMHDDAGTSSPATAASSPPRRCSSQRRRLSLFLFPI